MEEIFKQHKSGYWVSNKGRIKGQRVDFLKKTISRDGYECCFNFVHRIVVETFIGEIPKGYAVNHIDGCKTNNCVENLEIVTYSQNVLHAYKIGLQKIRLGEEVANSTLTEKQVIEMYQMFLDGITNDIIAEKFFVHSRYVSLIRHGKRWKYLWKQFFKDKSLVSLGSGKLSLKEMLSVIQMIVDEKMTNKEIGDLYNLDKSTISKVRHKHSWKEVWEFYYNPKSIATTIENKSEQEIVT